MWVTTQVQGKVQTWCIHLDSLVSELLGDICEPAPLLDKLLGDVMPWSSSTPL